MIRQHAGSGRSELALGRRTSSEAPTERFFQISNLAVSFRSGDTQSLGVVDCSLAVSEATRVGLIGESGSGKSVTALAALGLLDPTTATLGESSSISFMGRELVGMTLGELREIRGSEIAIVFQDPMNALNPVFRVGDQMAAALRAKHKMSRSDARQRVLEALHSVEIHASERVIDAYPHQLSGGMRQRVLIGAALLERPRLLIADEPTSALDVTVQADILSMLHSVVTERRMSILLVTHDIGVVAQFCDYLYVMYAGRIVESGPAREIISSPLHPYTIGLLGCTPSLEGGRRRLVTLPGSQPVAGRANAGCAFAPRCSRADGLCRHLTPKMVTHSPGRNLACHHPEIPSTGRTLE
ncbi:MAG: peptide ABC transporter ATP-binding protein [Acidobacteria bacterium]|nr:MAG: peptide ABC transporter ATP-binding protein [Acidobacteriota bacterium]